jgi:hypothetical protein
LFYKDRKFISYGKIINTSKCEETAKEIFGNSIYNLIIIMEQNKIIDQTRDKLWKVFNYSESARIQGMMIPNIKIQNELLNNYRNNIKELVYDLLDEKGNVV